MGIDYATPDMARRPPPQDEDVGDGRAPSRVVFACIAIDGPEIITSQMAE
ncbi:MAG: hypothetical protein AB7S71_16215 [Dongiaceae bacterium]